MIGDITVRADSGFYTHAIVAVCRKMKVRFSITIRQHQSLRNLIEAIPESDWRPIPYWMDGGADVAEIYTPFKTEPDAAPVRLIGGPPPALRPGQHGDILEIRNLTDIDNFTEVYSEAKSRSCLVKVGSGYGLHIDWVKVKENFKGILVSPFHPKAREQEKYHWHTFDCASGCFWNTSCLELVSWTGPVCEE